jgi:hypothetical protein
MAFTEFDRRPSFDVREVKLRCGGWAVATAARQIDRRTSMFFFMAMLAWTITIYSIIMNLNICATLFNK